MTEFRGNLYHKDSTDCLSVTMEVADRELVLRCDGTEVNRVPLERIQLSAGGFDGKRLFISDTGSGITVISDNVSILNELEGVEALKGSVKEVRGHLADVPRKERRAWGILVGVLVALGIGIYMSVDAFVALAAKHIPPSLEKQLGKLVMSSYKSKNKLQSTGPEVERAKKIVDRLTKQLKNNPYEFEVWVEPSEDVNAFAVPGGNVVVLSGLLKNAKTDHEIAGVLGHEIGHVIGRHSLKSALHKAGLIACLTIIFQGQGADQAVWLSSLIDLESLQFGRHQEEEADTTGIELAYKADYDPNGLIAFFERVQKLEGSTTKILNNKALEILSTHPYTPDRIARIKKEIARVKSATK